MTCAVNPTIRVCCPDRPSRLRILLVASQAIQPRHLDVHQNQIEPFLRREFHRDVPIVRDRYSMAMLVQQSTGDSLVDRVVLRYQDGEHTSCPPLRWRGGAGRLRRCVAALRRNEDAEGTAHSQFALHFHTAAHQLHEPRRNRESETGSTETASRRSVNLAEWFEDGL